MSEELKAITEIVKANSTALYTDSAQPSVRVLGKSLAQCVSLFATPVGRMAEIFERNIHRYLDKLDGLQESDIVAPNTRILVPILERMRFTEEEKVAEYYAQILATASTKEHSGKVLVTFIEILNRLTADEIKILEYINSAKNKINIPEITDDEITRYGLKKGNVEFSLGNSFPIIDVNIKTEGQDGFRIFIKNFSCLDEKVVLDTPSNLGSYLDNMISLGLLEREFGATFAIDKVYHHLENHKTITSMQEKLKQGQKLDFSHGRIDTTNLGAKLLKLCSPKDETKI